MLKKCSPAFKKRNPENFLKMLLSKNFFLPILILYLVAKRYGLENRTTAFWTYLVNAISINYMYVFIDEKNVTLTAMNEIHNTIKSVDGSVSIGEFANIIST